MFVALVSVATASNAPLVVDERTTKVDALFAAWGDGRGPGAVCYVVEDGKPVFAKAYGLAKVDGAIALTVESAFNLASIAKQFTAASVALLAIEGKVALDSDIHRYFPEFRDYGTPITVANLIYQTSGIRDCGELIGLAGWSGTEPIDNEKLVALVASQHALQFTPGSQFGYSNSNYLLLAELVRRVSGQPFSQFATERLFRPLGMNATRFADLADEKGGSTVGYRVDEKGAYLSYADRRGEKMWSTASDLARWDENFYTGKAGGKPLIELLRKCGPDIAGQPANYGFGLFFGTYRGLPIIEHSGLDAGFRGELLRFPEQHVSVIVLGNVMTVQPEDLARAVADVFLANHFQPTPAPATIAAPPPKKITLTPAQCTAYLGWYALNNAPDVYVWIRATDNQVSARWSGQRRMPIFPSSEADFFYEGSPSRITFQREADGHIDHLTLHENGEHKATRVSDKVLPESEFAVYEGEYTSEDIAATYTITHENGGLVARTAPFAHTAPLKPLYRDAFALPVGHEPGNFIYVSHGSIVFQRDGEGRVSGFALSGERVSHLLFTRRGTQ